MKPDSKIYVTHHHDMIGKGIIEALKREGYYNIIVKTTDELDLTDDKQTHNFFKYENPEYVFCFAGPHGGIIANVTYPGDFIYTNLKIQNNIIHNSYLHGVKKLLFMVGNCVYPKICKQPIIEDYFMNGKMETTSEAYSTARAAGIVMCGAYNRQYNSNFVPAVLTNYYGEGDDFSENGHVLASVIKKMYAAKKANADLTLWGDGTPKRQFMYIDDIATAALTIMNKYESTDLINIAGGKEFSIAELSGILKLLMDFKNNILFDTTKPNGSPRKLLDNSKLMGLGFQEKITFESGLKKTFDYFINNKNLH